MPPKVKITIEMVIDAAFDIVRTEGADRITARRISERLSCSTQPVLYHFASIEEIKRTVYQKADEYHTKYVMNMDKLDSNPMRTIGLNYIRFSREESHLFRFLFQSNEFSGVSTLDLIDSEELGPIMSIVTQELKVSLSEAKEIFSTLFVFVHGYASLYANNSLLYDEKSIIKSMERVFFRVVSVVKEGENEETI